MKTILGLCSLIALCLLAAVGVTAQSDALNLPADLYVLLNDGVVERYGVGASGIETITPEDRFVLDFGVSPDGTQIAYRTEDGLYLASLNGQLPVSGERIDITAGVPPVRGRADTVAWSPAGDAIAYTSLTGVKVYFTGGAFADVPQADVIGLHWSPVGSYLLIEAQFNIWWVYRRDNTVMTLVAAIPSALGAAWVSENELAFTPADGGLVLMSLARANAQTVLASAENQYRLPHLSAADQLLVFQRDPADENVPEGYGTLVALPRGVPELETLGSTPINLTGGLRWAPGGSLMIAFQGGVLALFDPLTGSGFPLPVTNAVAYGWGPYPPPASAPVAGTTEEAIFPDEFPTLAPDQTLPGLTSPPPTQERFPTEPPAPLSTEEAGSFG